MIMRHIMVSFSIPMKEEKLHQQSSNNILSVGAMLLLCYAGGKNNLGLGRLKREHSSFTLIGSSGWRRDR